MQPIKSLVNIILIFCLFFIKNLVAQPPGYPNFGSDYTKKQLEGFVEKYSIQKDTLGLAYTYWLFAKYQEKQSAVDETPITNLRKSMECFQIIKDSVNFYHLRGEIGSYFMDRPYIKQSAKAYIEEAVTYFRKIKKYNSELEYLVNLANVFIHENNFVTSSVHLKRVEFLLTQVTNELAEGRLASAYSDFYVRQNQFEKAASYAQKSLETGKKLEINWLQALSYLKLAQCKMAQNKPDEMLALLLKSESICKQNINLLQLEIEVLGLIRQYFDKQKDVNKAYEYALKINDRTQKLYFSKIEGDVRSFNEYRLLEEQKMVISKIELEKKLAESEIEKLIASQQRFIAFIIVILLLLVLTLLAYFTRQRLNKWKNQELQKNAQIEKLNALIYGQEQERLRVAQELHDGLGTLLSRIKILLSTGINHQKLNAIIDEACSEVRTISSNLQPSSLAKFGLVHAVQDLINKLKVNSVEIVFQHFGEPLPIETNKNLMIYRIIQELITNSLKHSNATEIIVQIVFADDPQINITVEDNGIGFDETIASVDNHGWPNIRSRVSYLEGSISLQSNKNEGTSVTILVPRIMPDSFK